MTASNEQNLVDHLFRHESGKMIAVVVRMLGVDHLQVAEDLVQEAFYQALHTWPYTGIPIEPAAWLTQVAKRRAIDWMRKNQVRLVHHSHMAREENLLESNPLPTLPDELQDSQLQLVFAICHPALSPEDQIALTLKIASGFGTHEIASALMTREETIRKRIYRARQTLQTQRVDLAIPGGSVLTTRLQSVLKVFYLLFNEGYLASHPEWVVRQELCAEAMRLTHLVWQHPRTRRGEVAALMALMSYHTSRLASRTTEDHELILLADQDRRLWNQSLIRQGHYFLQQALTFKPISIYHLEAAISGQHCIAPTLAATDWPRILHLYEVLEEVQPSPVLRLNKVVVLLQMQQLETAADLLKDLKQDRAMMRNHFYYAVKAAYHQACGETVAAREALEQALLFTSHPASSRLYIDKLNRLSDGKGHHE
ncbi:MAG: sigma-70 family RNA polymerase sigma factor [Saprospiraceae bacterium]